MIRDRYPWPKRSFFSSYRAFLSLLLSWLYGSPFISLGNLFGQRRVYLWTHKYFGAGSRKKRRSAVGLVSIMGWNTKRMQTWNNMTLDRAFRCGILSLSFFSPIISFLISRSHWYLILIIFARGPSSKRWDWKLKTMSKKPLYFWNPRQSLFLTVIQLQKDWRCNSGSIKIYRAILLQTVWEYSLHI